MPVKKYDTNETFDSNNRLHSFNDQPAVVKSRGKKSKLEIWYKHGKIHRDDDKPAIVKKHYKGVYKEKVWYQNDIIKRGNNEKHALERVIIKYASSGKTKSCIWYCGGVIHRKFLPAIVTYNDGDLAEQIWVQHGELYREPKANGKRNYVYKETGFCCVTKLWKDYNHNKYNMIHRQDCSVTKRWVIDIKLVLQDNGLPFVHYVKHRISAPAVIVKHQLFNNTIEEIHNIYFLYGELIN